MGVRVLTCVCAYVNMRCMRVSALTCCLPPIVPSPPPTPLNPPSPPPPSQATNSLQSKVDELAALALAAGADASAVMAIKYRAL